MSALGLDMFVRSSKQFADLQCAYMQLIGVKRDVAAQQDISAARWSLNHSWSGFCLLRSLRTQ